jgi:hypothetical protein
MDLAMKGVESGVARILGTFEFRAEDNHDFIGTRLLGLLTESSRKILVAVSDFGDLHPSIQ